MSELAEMIRKVLETGESVTLTKEQTQQVHKEFVEFAKANEALTTKVNELEKAIHICVKREVGLDFQKRENCVKSFLDTYQESYLEQELSNE